MKNTLFVLVSSAALLAIAFSAGCVAGSATKKSARHAIINAGSPGVEATWTPDAGQVATLERKLARMFTTPDPRISGLADGIPPYPLSKYNIRYTGTGPADRRYILGEAAHKDTPEAEKILAPGGFTMPKGGGPRYFTIMYRPDGERIDLVRFNEQ